MRIRSLGLMLPGLAVAGCSSGSEPSGAAYTLQSVTAPPAQSLPGQVFDSIRIRVVTRANNPRADIPVTFSGDGTFEPTQATTGVDGTVLVRWSLPSTRDIYNPFPTGPSGNYQMTAAAGDQAVHLTTSAHAFELDKVDASSSAACGIRDQALWCWGNMNGSMDVPEGAQDAIPNEYTTIGAVQEVVVTEYAVCVLEITSHPWCSTQANGAQFNPVSGAPKLVYMSDGIGYVCGLGAESGDIWCWYTDGPAAMQARRIPSALRFQGMGAGGGYSATLGEVGFGCGITAANAVWCWGRNNLGQLGNGTNEDSETPLPVAGEHAFASMLVSNNGACAQTAFEIWCWGFRGPLTTQSNVPVLVNPTRPVSLQALGDFEAYMATANGTEVWSNGTTENIGLDALGIGEISSDGQMCGLTASNEVFCSWIIVYGGGDSFVTPSGLVPVPAPGATPAVPLLRASQ